MSVPSALAEWQRARAALGAAASCQRDGYYADAVSRGYYAVLHAARAALELHDLPTETHASTNRMFGYRIARSGLVEAHFGNVITDLANARRNADYVVDMAFHEADADAAYARAEAFLNRVRELLVRSIPDDQLQ